MAFHKEIIAEALFEVLKDAPDAELATLKIALESFANNAPRSLRDVRRQPFAAAMLDAMNEAIRYNAGPMVALLENNANGR